jgi:hypothetical protein
MKVKYHQDQEFSLIIRCLPALALLPVCDVVDGFEDLLKNENLPVELTKYFETYYIGNARGRGNNKRRIVPMFPIETWNVRERTVMGMPRTNNNVESFHNAIQSSISCIHPTIWKLIDELKKEECLATLKKVQFNRGNTLDTKKIYKDKNVNIQILIDRYNSEDKLYFIKGIASLLKLP